MSAEFDLIRRCFTRPTRHTDLGIGDDGALITPPPGQQLVVSTDLLVEGTHFFPDTDPESLGWKTLAVNVSDIAAMGAVPRWATLGTVLPAPTLDWLDAFSRGFFACASEFGIDLIGGDTTRGSIRTFSVTILGEVPTGRALRRDGAQVGDSIWVSGTPGRAALGLAHLQGRTTLLEPQLSQALAALHRPQPRVELGLALRELPANIVTAAIDVSDGLLADLGHILEQSGRSARLQIASLPDASLERACLLAGGDDYELVFTATPSATSVINALGQKLTLPLTCIGTVTAADTLNPVGSLKLYDTAGSLIPLSTLGRLGYDHFQHHG